MRFELANKQIWFYILSLISLVYISLSLLLFLNILDSDQPIYSFYTDTYGIIAGIGGVIGIYISNKWGGLKSVVGRAILMFSVGILFQFLGQVSYGIHRYITGIEDPYPGPGEIFYMLSIPIYIYGIWQIAVASGIKFVLRNNLYKALSLIAIISMVGLSYWLFLSHYEGESLLLLLIEFWYPIGQALYVTLAILALILSNNLLGGEMKSKVYLVLAAFIIQYVADTYFTIEYNLDAFSPGGVSDLLYVISYYFMGLALYKFGDLPDKIRKSK